MYELWEWNQQTNKKRAGVNNNKLLVVAVVGDDVEVRPNKPPEAAGVAEECPVGAVVVAGKPTIIVEINLTIIVVYKKTYQ